MLVVEVFGSADSTWTQPAYRQPVDPNLRYLYYSAHGLYLLMENPPSSVQNTFLHSVQSLL